MQKFLLMFNWELLSVEHAILLIFFPEKLRTLALWTVYFLLDLMYGLKF